MFSVTARYWISEQRVKILQVEDRCLQSDFNHHSMTVCLQLYPGAHVNSFPFLIPIEASLLPVTWTFLMLKIMIPPISVSTTIVDILHQPGFFLTQCQNERYLPMYVMHQKLIINGSLMCNFFLCLLHQPPDQLSHGKAATGTIWIMVQPLDQGTGGRLLPLQMI